MIAMMNMVWHVVAVSGGVHIKVYSGLWGREGPYQLLLLIIS